MTASPVPAHTERVCRVAASRADRHVSGVPLRSAGDRAFFIRSRLASGATEFVVFAAGAEDPIGGPFISLHDAVTFALTQDAHPLELYYEAFDERGRALGAPLRLRVESA